MSEQGGMLISCKLLDKGLQMHLCKIVYSESSGKEILSNGWPSFSKSFHTKNCAPYWAFRLYITIPGWRGKKQWSLLAKRQNKTLVKHHAKPLDAKWQHTQPMLQRVGHKIEKAECRANHRKCSSAPQNHQPSTTIVRTAHPRTDLINHIITSSRQYIHHHGKQTQVGP